jgi:hypothetical protein
MASSISIVTIVPIVPMIKKIPSVNLNLDFDSDELPVPLLSRSKDELPHQCSSSFFEMTSSSSSTSYLNNRFHFPSSFPSYNDNPYQDHHHQNNQDTTSNQESKTLNEKK